MTLAPRSFDNLADAYRMALEEELSGAGFFAALALDQSDARQAGLLRLMELMELKTAALMTPGARVLGIAPRDAATLRAEGISDAAPWSSIGWDGILGRMADEFPVYLEEFVGLLSRCPPELKPPVQMLCDHEVAIIDFARAERAGADGTGILIGYLRQADACLAGRTG